MCTPSLAFKEEATTTCATECPGLLLCMEDKLERLDSEAQDKAPSVNPHSNTTTNRFFEILRELWLGSSSNLGPPPPGLWALLYYVCTIYAHPEDSGGPNSRNSMSLKFSVDGGNGIHSKLRIITSGETKVPVILRSFVVLIWMCDIIELV